MGAIAKPKNIMAQFERMSHLSEIAKIFRTVRFRSRAFDGWRAATTRARAHRLTNKALLFWSQRLQRRCFTALKSFSAAWRRKTVFSSRVLVPLPFSIAEDDDRKTITHN